MKQANGSREKFFKTLLSELILTLIKFLAKLSFRKQRKKSPKQNKKEISKHFSLFLLLVVHREIQKYFPQFFFLLYVAYAPFSSLIFFHIFFLLCNLTTSNFHCHTICFTPCLWDIIPFRHMVSNTTMPNFFNYMKPFIEPIVPTDLSVEKETLPQRGQWLIK